MTDLTMPEIVVRLSLAAFAGIILGAERETHGRAAGLRTTLLVCLGAAVGAIVAQMMEANHDPSLTTWGPEAGRLAQGLLAGIGFLGAGAIVREGTAVRGVTTAAVIWISTLIGLAIGSGAFFLGYGTVALVMLAQLLLPVVEKRILKNHYATLVIEMESDTYRHQSLCEILTASGCKIRSSGCRLDRVAHTSTGTFHVAFKDPDIAGFPDRICERLTLQPGIRKVDWQ